MKTACAARSGALRYVTRASKCAKKTERAVKISAAKPVDICVAAKGGGARLVTSPRCRAKESAATLPAVKQTLFCARKPSGKLRRVAKASKCSKKLDVAVFV